MSSLSNKIAIAARGSPLSRAQFAEFAALCPHLALEPIWVTTTGDLDQATSLRTLDKTDFFTREIDAMQLNGECRLALHSAKDLPDPLPEGLVLAALTKGVDPSDTIVLRPGETLKSGMRIATSSERRETALLTLCPGLRCLDIRGPIHTRLKALDDGAVDGVVIAEAALIRLGMTHLNRISLPGPTAPLQGQLAVIARAEDTEMRLTLSLLDCRRRHRTLYLGLNPENHPRQPAQELFHYPVIRTLPRASSNPDIQQALSELDTFSHVIFTSKTAVTTFVPLTEGRLSNKIVLAVGSVTAEALAKHHLKADMIAEEETADGIIDLLEHLYLKRVLWPHSSRSRCLITDYLRVNRVPFAECLVYDTEPHSPFPLPPIDAVDEIVFTSPSTVDGFLKLMPTLPRGKRFTTQGPVTRKYLSQITLY